MSEAQSRPARVLFDAWTNKLTGAITFDWEDHPCCVFLKNGTVIDVQGSREVLEVFNDKLPARERNGDLVDDASRLVALGVPPDEVFQGAGQGLGRLLARREERADLALFVEEGRSPRGGGFPLPDAIPRILTRGFREIRGARDISRRLKQRRDEVLRPAGTPPRQGLDAATARTLRQLGQGRTLRDLLADQPSSARKAATFQAIDLLLALGLVELAPGEAAEPAEPAEPAKPAKAAKPARPAKPAPGGPADPAPQGPISADDRIKEYQALAESLAALTPLEALECDLELDPSESVSLAFRNKAKDFHPDALTSEPAEVQMAAAAVFAILSDHYDKLSDEEHRTVVFAEAIAERDGTVYVHEADAKIARLHFRKAQGYEQQKRWDQAREELAVARELDPRQDLFRVLDVFLQVVQQELPAAKGVAAVDGLACKDLPEQVEAAFRTGWMLRMGGDVHGALKRFEKVLELSPNHHAAQREIRLLKRRQGG